MRFNKEHACSNASFFIILFPAINFATFSKLIMTYKPVIGIDLGGTHVRAAVVANQSAGAVQHVPITAGGTKEAVLQTVYNVADAIMQSSVAAIGIGVPSVVDVDTGIVYDVQNIPSWKEVPLKKLMEERYKVPVFVNNDANCFALGELYFGEGRGSNSLIGLSIGTGLGAGIIINRKLHAGPNCGAGEFGMVAYKDHYYEWYASGQFFKMCTVKTAQPFMSAQKKGIRMQWKCMQRSGCISARR
jgi:glucokinase